MGIQLKQEHANSRIGAKNRNDEATADPFMVSLEYYWSRIQYLDIIHCLTFVIWGIKCRILGNWIVKYGENTAK